MTVYYMTGYMSPACLFLSPEGNIAVVEYLFISMIKGCSLSCALSAFCYAGSSLSCAGTQRWKSVSFHC